MTSIHQPNNDLLMLFDSLYVLAKGGICIYNGTPDHLYHNLEQVGIECKEYQAPVEVLMKSASLPSNGRELLFEQTMKNKTLLEEKCAIEGKLSSYGVPHKSVGFSPRHFLYLIGREMTSLYVSQWKSMIFQFGFVIFGALILVMVFDRHIGEADGCFIRGQSSNRTNLDEELYMESLLIQNRAFLLYTITINLAVNLMSILLFEPEIRIFFNEHTNGDYV